MPLSERRVKILVADDSELSRRLLEVSLTKRGYEVMTAADGNQAWRLLEQEDGLSLAILDWMMPGIDGLDLCRRLRQQAREPYVYVILLTAKDRKEDIVDGLRAGADDYLKKPVDGDELEARLRTGRRIVDLQSELIAAREALRNRADHDALTGLWNRGAICEVLGRELSRARRCGAPLAVAIVDLDHFKSINDTHGHAAGDAVLREAGSRMSSSLRPYDSVGRYGGEEFLIVLPGCDVPFGLACAERLRASLAKEAIQIGDTQVPVTCSVGVAATGGGRETDAESILAAADQALYRAKADGRNRVCAALKDRPIGADG
jgi:diguanylate cyclase (GGDEF)-like protein